MYQNFSSELFRKTHHKATGGGESCATKISKQLINFRIIMSLNFSHCYNDASISNKLPPIV